MPSPAPSAPLIVCGVDFSERSAPIVRVAAWFAQRLGTRLEVVTALDRLLAQAADLRLEPGALEAETRRDLEALVARAIAPLSARPEVTTRVETGTAADVLRETADAEHAALVVVGTRGHGAAKRLWFGSTTARLLATATRPVLAVPDAWTEPGAPATPAIARVVCAVDFQPPSIAAAARGAEVGAALGVPVTLVHAVARPDAAAPWQEVVDEAVADQAQAAHGRLEALARELPGPPDVQVVTGRPAEALLELASPETLLVVGLGGGLTHRPGSTAMHLLVHSRALVVGTG